MNEWKVTDSGPHTPLCSAGNRGGGSLPGGAPRGGEDIPGEALDSSQPLCSALAPQAQGAGGTVQGSPRQEGRSQGLTALESLVATPPVLEKVTSSPAWSRGWVLNPSPLAS